ERGELTREQRRADEMAGAVRQPPRQLAFGRLQVHEADPPGVAAQNLTIGTLQGRTGQHEVLASIRRVGNGRVQRRQPRCAIGIGQRDAGVHLLDVARRMPIVALDERPRQVGGEPGADRRFASAGRAHQNDDHASIVCRAASPDNAAGPDRAEGMDKRPNNEAPAAQDLAPRVYDELRRLAAAYMRRERPGQTLQPTALVHEVYLRLAGAGTPWHDERHFVGIAARSMRQILVERARARGAQKRWAGLDRVSLTDSLVRASAEDAMLPALDDALRRLEQIDPEQAKIVELRYFAGFGIDEA